MNIIILCGGKGSRLWPLSRDKTPKQFLSLINDKTMFQNTLVRFKDMNTNVKFTFICNNKHADVVKNQTEELELGFDYKIICEPEGRDTSAAICLTTLLLNENEISIIIPADHIFNDEEICNVLTMGKFNIKNNIITFGIRPTYPETGYGYIEVGNNFKTLSFKEKPDKENAEGYILNGNYYWNAGIFMYENRNMKKCFLQFAKDIMNDCKLTIDNSKWEDKKLILNKEYFSKVREISIDYAIMEPLMHIKNNNNLPSGMTLPYNNKWVDIGSFKSMYDEMEKDGNGNAIKGTAVTLDTKNCLIQSNKMIATIGLEDLIIIDTEDALLICPTNKCQDVKKIQKIMKTNYKNLV